jgi:hypothetical protein
MAGLDPRTLSARLDAVLKATRRQAADLVPYGIRADTQSHWKKGRSVTAPRLRHVELALGIPRGSMEWGEREWGILLNVLKIVAAKTNPEPPGQGVAYPPDAVDTLLSGAAELVEQARQLRQSRTLLDSLEALPVVRARDAKKTGTGGD